MKITSLREFRKNQTTKLSDVIDFLAGEFSATMRELRTGLQKLNFLENFDSFQVDLSIAAGIEAAVPNQIKNGIPSYWIALRKNEAGLSVCDGSSEWTLNYLYLKNVHATDTAEVTVVFFR